MDYIWLGPKVIQKLFESYYQRGAGHKVGKLLSIRDAIFPAGDHVAGGGGGKGTGPTLLLLCCQAQSRSQVPTGLRKDRMIDC